MGIPIYQNNQPAPAPGALAGPSPSQLNGLSNTDGLSNANGMLNQQQMPGLDSLNTPANGLSNQLNQLSSQPQQALTNAADSLASNVPSTSGLSR